MILKIFSTNFKNHCIVLWIGDYLHIETYSMLILKNIESMKFLPWEICVHIVLTWNYKLIFEICLLLKSQRKETIIWEMSDDIKHLPQLVGENATVYEWREILTPSLTSHTYIFPCCTIGNWKFRVNHFNIHVINGL